MFVIEPGKSNNKIRKKIAMQSLWSLVQCMTTNHFISAFEI